MKTPILPLAGRRFKLGLRLTRVPERISISEHDVSRQSYYLGAGDVTYKEEAEAKMAALKKEADPDETPPD